nr:P-loop NTPase fold protein [uncultured Bacteroides sp.]
MKVLSIAEDKLQTIQDLFTTSAMDVVSTNLRTEMSRLERKVVVFVDDIDRLNKDEILQVFKLVRNTSNFPNMYFILAYDRQYIIHSLGKQFARQGLLFTEKIMQEEFELMPATTDQLREELLRLFSAFLNDNEQKAIQSLLLGQNYYKFLLTNYVKTLREAKRLANSMYMNYIKMREEVNVNDFLLYEIMKSCYPFVTRFIKSNMESLFILQNNERLFLIDGKRNPEKESDLKYLNNHRINFEEYIKAQHDDLHLEEKDVLCVMNLMSVLFGEYKQALVCSINNINYIHRYFLNNLLENDIQEKQYSQIMSLPFVQAKAQLTEWAHNQSRNLVVRLAKSDPQDKEYLKHVLRVMFYVNAISNKWNNDVYEIDRKIHKLKTFNYETLNYSEEDKFFVQQLLTENGYNSFVAKYIYNLFEHSSWDYLIDKDVIIGIQTQFLKDVIKSNELSAKVVFTCWNYSGNKIRVSKGNGYYTHIEYPTENNDLMKKYAESHLEDFIPLTFRYWSPNEYRNYGLNSATRILWGSYDNYYSYISNQENTPILKEYKKFLKKLKEKGFGDDAEVHFVFKEISVNV